MTLPAAPVAVQPHLVGRASLRTRPRPLYPNGSSVASPHRLRPAVPTQPHFVGHSARGAHPTPTQLERDTLLTPEWVAERVVQEAECFLHARLRGEFVERLAAKAYYCYDRNKHFHRVLNRRGDGGRETLYMFRRHWSAAWLKRERHARHKKLPWSDAQGRPLLLQRH